jgi:hypothetical protein
VFAVRTASGQWRASRASLHRSGAETFSAGDLVRIAIAGEAHVFDGR